MEFRQDKRLQGIYLSVIIFKNNYYLFFFVDYEKNNPFIFKVYVCEMEMDSQICIKRNIHGRTDEEINRIVDYFEPTPNYHQKLDVTSLLQDQAIQDVCIFK